MKKEDIKEGIDLIKIMIRLQKQKQLDHIYKIIFSYVSEEDMNIVQKEYQDKLNEINHVIQKLSALLKEEKESFNTSEIELISSSFYFYKLKCEEEMSTLNLTKANMEKVKERYKQEYILEIQKVKEVLSHFNIELV